MVDRNKARAFNRLKDFENEIEFHNIAEEREG